jgi:hypothetical protein
VKATLRPKSPLENREVMEQIWSDFADDASKHSPALSARLPYTEVIGCPDPTRPQLLEIVLNDPHLGMLAWGKECGVPYDLKIGIEDYRTAFRGLLSMHAHYNVEKILLLIGNDLFHVDGTMEGGKGATTTKGTQQDFDSRLARMFTKVRRLLVDCIDEARVVAPVDVQIVPGNHDRHTMYKFGEVLNAWYRLDEHVNVKNPPAVRDYYLYGSNLFMFTHGLEFARKRDNLVSVFATECPPELWVKGKIREVHLGHKHINMEKIFTGDPHDTIWEGRATRIRSLPGLTPEDAWHFEEGYKHQRRGTALVWHRAGGLAGLHEFTL